MLQEFRVVFFRYLSAVVGHSAGITRISLPTSNCETSKSSVTKDELNLERRGSLGVKTGYGPQLLNMKTLYKVPYLANPFRSISTPELEHSLRSYYVVGEIRVKYLSRRHSRHQTAGMS